MNLRTVLFLCGALTPLARAQTPIPPAGSTTVFWEAAFPTVDSAPVPQSALRESLGGDVHFADLLTLQTGVPAHTRLLVLPYGSAFPIAAWSPILNYLKGGGNVLVIGGEPFRVPVSSEDGQFVAGIAQDRFSRAVGILHAYEAPKASDDHFAWRHDYQFLPALSVSAARSFVLEGHLNGLGYLENAAGDKVSSPIVVAPHGSGRAVYLDFQAKPGYWESNDGHLLLRTAASYARSGNITFSADLLFSTLRVGELPLVSVHVHNAGGGSLALVFTGDDPGALKTIPLASGDTDLSFDVPGAFQLGLHVINAQLMRDGQPIESCENAFWVADDASLKGGPVLGANETTLTINGHPFFPVGTNYFSTESNGWDFGGPRNAAVWESDFADMEKHGVTFVRTGVWGGQFRLTENGQVTEQFLRNVEAYLLCARRHHIAVNFTFFAFDPQTTMRLGESNPLMSLPGSNPYLDPVTVHAEQAYMLSIVNRFKDVPDLSWDLINEPSFANPRALWHNNTPNEDPAELHAWREWLKEQYSDPAQLAAAWSVSPDQVTSFDSVALPSGKDLSLDLENSKENMVRATDYNRFAQEAFSRWVESMVKAIRSTGSAQIVDVGQDEGGIESRVLNQFYAHSGIAFTTNHTYRQNQNLLWDSWAAKAPGVPNIVGETGYQPVTYPNGDWHFDELTGLSVLENKWTAGFAAGTTGFLSWDWDREIYFGLLRSDGSEKLWQDMTRALSKFANTAAPYATAITPAETAIVLPQSLQLSVLNPLALEAQKRALQALYGVARSTAYAVGEDQLAYLGHPKLIILPSPWVIGDKAWSTLLDAVRAGATLLVSGRVDLDAHFLPTNRAAELGITGYRPALLSAVETQFRWPGGSSTLTFAGNKPDLLQHVDFADGSTFRTLTLGDGHILLASEPLEWNDNVQAIGAVYHYATQMAKVNPTYTTHLDNPALLICPTVFPHATLYALSSQTAQASTVQFRDARSGKVLSGQLDGGRSALILISDSGSVLASYNWR